MAQESSTIKVGFIGGGKMAKAMAVALVRARVCSAEDICMSARTEASCQAISALGYSTRTNEEVVRWAQAGLLFLTVKPWNVPEVLASLALWREESNALPFLVSACAGVSLSRLEETTLNSPVARIMPNVLCAVGEGSTCYCGKHLTADNEAVLLRALRAFGRVHSVPESYFDAYCAISGSSPAFVCTFIEALIDAGVKCGLPRQLATEAALQSVRGTATLVQKKEIHPALIRDEITTPGGTTIAGLMAMERRAFRAAVADAVQATYERSVEMTENLDNKDSSAVKRGE